MNVKEFAKSVFLNTDEKLLIKHGLWDINGTATEDAREIVIDKLIKDSKEFLVKIATEKDKEERKK